MISLLAGIGAILLWAFVLWSIFVATTPVDHAQNDDRGYDFQEGFKE